MIVWRCSSFPWWKYFAPHWQLAGQNKHVQYIHWSKKRKHAFNSRSSLTSQTNHFLLITSPSKSVLLGFQPAMDSTISAEGCVYGQVVAWNSCVQLCCVGIKCQRPKDFISHSEDVIYQCTWKTRQVALLLFYPRGTRFQNWIHPMFFSAVWWAAELQTGAEMAKTWCIPWLGDPVKV